MEVFFRNLISQEDRKHTSKFKLLREIKESVERPESLWAALLPVQNASAAWVGGLASPAPVSGLRSPTANGICSL